VLSAVVVVALLFLKSGVIASAEANPLASVRL